MLFHDTVATSQTETALVASSSASINIYIGLNSPKCLTGSLPVFILKCYCCFDLNHLGMQLCSWNVTSLVRVKREQWLIQACYQNNDATLHFEMHLRITVRIGSCPAPSVGQISCLASWGYWSYWSSFLWWSLRLMCFAVSNVCILLPWLLCGS